MHQRVPGGEADLVLHISKRDQLEPILANRAEAVSAMRRWSSVAYCRTGWQSGLDWLLTVKVEH